MMFFFSTTSHNPIITSHMYFSLIGSAEDLVGQSFAGQYDTFLYKSTVDDIVTSIKGCWSSMFKEHILDYVARPVFLEKNDDVYEPDTMNSPQMGVLIMEMVEATSAGVCFSQNLWGAKSEVMIEAGEYTCMNVHIVIRPCMCAKNMYII